MYVMQK